MLKNFKKPQNRENLKTPITIDISDDEEAEWDDEAALDGVGQEGTRNDYEELAVVLSDKKRKRMM